MALRNGSRFSVRMHDVFPHGCHLVPDSITEAQDYDEKTKRRTPAVDKVTGKRVWQCRVVDMDPNWKAGPARSSRSSPTASRPRPPAPRSRPSSSRAWSSPPT